MTDRTIYAAVAVDDFHVMPLTVMLRSAGANLSPDWRLEVFILGYRIAPETRRRLEDSLWGLPVKMHWEVLDLAAVAPYWPGILQEGNITCYYRLFLGEVLPASIEQVLFLDADLLVEGDLARLWVLPFDGCIVQAVPDAYARTNHLRRLGKVEFSEGIRFDTGTPYFNAGVQLIDLAAWRAERIGQYAAAFLWKYGEQLAGRDQDALNCALAGRWKRLGPTWNLQELPDRPRHWEDGGATPDEMREALSAPAIVHFIGWKPWSPYWRPLSHARWWGYAREAGVDPVRRPVHLVIWETLLRAPHCRLAWYLVRRQWNRVPAILLTRPWTLLTYPIWRASRR